MERAKPLKLFAKLKLGDGLSYRARHQNIEIKSSLTRVKAYVFEEILNWHCLSFKEGACILFFPSYLKTDQNVWCDHATMQQDILLHFWVIFLC